MTQNTNLNYEDMLAQVKENIKKVEEEGQTSTQFVFTSPRAASDFFYKIISEVEGWDIEACESRPIPAHYQNTCVLIRQDSLVKNSKEEEEVTNEEATQSSDTP